MYGILRIFLPSNSEIRFVVIILFFTHPPFFFLFFFFFFFFLTEPLSIPWKPMDKCMGELEKGAIKLLSKNNRRNPTKPPTTPTYQTNIVMKNMHKLLPFETRQEKKKNFFFVEIN